MGLRLALGAESSAIGRMVLKDGLRPVVAGLVLGLGLGVLGRLVVRATFAGTNVSPLDPSAFSLAALVLVVSAMAACYLPARRASRVDPNVALKEL
jgi:ABC-type antimicrobial peptide transport system permease subunit